MGLDFEDIDIEKDRELGYKERGIRPRELNTTPRYYCHLSSTRGNKERGMGGNKWCGRNQHEYQNWQHC